MKREMGIAV